MTKILNQNEILNLIKKKYEKKNFLQSIKQENINIGDLIKISYNSFENEKEKIHFYNGIVISIQNKNLNKSFTIRRNVQGIYLEQTFPVHSPKIISIEKKQKSKIRRAKLYFLRKLKNKITRLKIKK
jgi:large subunit ribosomal protein L19